MRLIRSRVPIILLTSATVVTGSCGLETTSPDDSPAPQPTLTVDATSAESAGTSLSPATSGSIAPTTSSHGAETAAVVLETDKSRYASSERITLRVANGLGASIWYVEYAEPDLIAWELERADGNSWVGLSFRIPVVEQGRDVCRLTLYERPVGDVTELPPGSTLVYEWDQLTCVFETVGEAVDPLELQSGAYRFAFRYSLETVQENVAETEPWKRPIELGESFLAYSNEFVID